MMLFDINNPRPVPFSDLVMNFVNSLGNTPSIPSHVSFTITIACLSFFSIDTDIDPSFVNMTALCSILENN
jgi:hypothetical protein